MATRRAFLAGLAAAPFPRASWAEMGSPAALAAGKQGADFVLHGLSGAGDSLFQVALPARGHAAAAHPFAAEAMAFARRPGTYALVIDCFSGQVRHQLAPPLGRQFNGHGAFSPDGTLAYTSEVVAETSEGRIGIWNASAAYTRLGEWPSHGIGPHDIKILPDGRLLIANGGIQTDPNDRRKLNIAAMRPNLALLSPDGALETLAELPRDMQQNSIRHIALLGAERVAFAMQWEGASETAVPQLGLWDLRSAPRLCPPLDKHAFALRGYAGSIAAAPKAGLIALTSAPAGAVMLFDLEGSPLSVHARADVSGVAALGRGLMATDGQGGLWRLDGTGLHPLRKDETQWDNHLVAL